MVLVGIEADALTSVGAESFCPEELSWLVVVGITAEAVAFDDAAGAVSLIGDERKESEDEGDSSAGQEDDDELVLELLED